MIKDLETGKFYHYSQNNSGGSFAHDPAAGISHFVIIQAFSAAHANERAESIGLYFDGDGDCPCCGERWSEQSVGWDEGYAVPSIYGTVVNLDGPMDRGDGFSIKWIDGPEGYVHYLDGTVRGFWSE